MHLCLHTVILFLLAPVEPFELIFAVFIQHFSAFTVIGIPSSSR